MKCKCRFCQTNLDTKDAYLQMIGKQKAYFCNEEHYNLLLKKKEQEDIEKQKIKEMEAAARQKKKEEEAAAIEERKQIKNKVYYLICEIINRKEIINTILWKEWALWNKVSANEDIYKYLDENRDYLISTIARLDNSEFLRIKYLSAILKNQLGDFKPNATSSETEKPKIKIDEAFYEPMQTKNNRRRSLADLEDDF